MAGDEKRGRWQGFDLGGGNRRWRLSIGYILVGLLVLWFIQAMLVPSPETIAYSRFLDLVERGRVESVAISEGNVRGLFRAGESKVEFVAVRPPGVDDQELIRVLQDKNVEFTGEQPSAFANFLFSWILPILVLVLIWS